MSRTTGRFSRRLIVALAVVVGLGSICVIYKVNHQAKPAAPNNPPRIALADLDPIPNKPATNPAIATASPAVLKHGLDLTNQAILASATTTAPSNPNNNLLAASSSGNSSLQSAQDELQAGHLITARDQFNDLLQSGNLNPANTQLVKQSLSEISQTTVFGRKAFANDRFASSYTVKGGDSLSKIAEPHDIAWEFIGRINNVDAKHLRAGASIKIIEGPFFAVVHKRQFLMDIYLGGLPGDKNSMYVTSYSVGLGRDDSTPLGTWVIEPQHKLKHPTYYSPHGEGVIPADDPKNPLGGYWIGLTGTDGDALGKMSYGIHGTIEPDSIGKQSSMGCIRLKADDIAMVYDLMVEGKSLVKVQE
jgi:LysM repeat protein